MPCKVLVLDYRTGNFAAVKRSIEQAGGKALVSYRTSDIQSCDKLVLAGVGHFDSAMAAIRELQLENVISEMVIVKKKPVLGICLGMELMAQKSEEGNATGLGWIDADVVRFSISDQIKYKVPQIGWNTLDPIRSTAFLRNIDSSSEFYFNHSFHLKVRDRSAALCETDYESTFVSAIEKDNIFGVQFHPEKSHDSGIRLLRNFVEI